jgi:plastocyanin
METQQKPPTPDTEKNLTGAMWAAGISFAAVVILSVLLFVLPSPSDVPSGTATTTDESVVTEVAKPAKPASGASSAVASYPTAGSRFLQNGVYVTVIHFNGKSFNPESLTLTHGEEVRFINTSNLTMDIGPALPNASSPGYSALNQPAAKGKGGIYQIGLTEIGVWAYANQTSNPAIKGIVNVK